jgi:hypothetical protein
VYGLVLTPLLWSTLIELVKHTLTIIEFASLFAILSSLSSQVVTTCQLHPGSNFNLKDISWRHLFGLGLSVSRHATSNMAANYWDSTQRTHWTFTKDQLDDIRSLQQQDDQELHSRFPLPEPRLMNIYIQQRKFVEIPQSPLG